MEGHTFFFLSGLIFIDRVSTVFLILLPAAFVCRNDVIINAFVKFLDYVISIDPAE